MKRPAKAPKRRSSSSSPASPPVQNANTSKPTTERTAKSCLDCLERKCRCDLVRPICGRCERLKLKCTWEPWSKYVTMYEDLIDLEGAIELIEAELIATTAPQNLEENIEALDMASGKYGEADGVDALSLIVTRRESGLTIETNSTNLASLNTVLLRLLKLDPGRSMPIFRTEAQIQLQRRLKKFSSNSHILLLSSPSDNNVDESASLFTEIEDEVIDYLLYNYFNVWQKYSFCAPPYFPPHTEQRLASEPQHYLFMYTICALTVEYAFKTTTFKNYNPEQSAAMRRYFLSKAHELFLESMDHPNLETMVSAYFLTYMMIQQKLLDKASIFHTVAVRIAVQLKVHEHAASSYSSADDISDRMLRLTFERSFWSYLILDDAILASTARCIFSRYRNIGNIKLPDISPSHFSSLRVSTQEEIISTYCLHYHAQITPVYARAIPACSPTKLLTLDAKLAKVSLPHQHPLIALAGDYKYRSEFALSKILRCQLFWHAVRLQVHFCLFHHPDVPSVQRQTSSSRILESIGEILNLYEFFDSHKTDVDFIYPWQTIRFAIKLLMVLGFEEKEKSNVAGFLSKGLWILNKQPKHRQDEPDIFALTKGLTLHMLEHNIPTTAHENLTPNLYMEYGINLVEKNDAANETSRIIRNTPKGKRRK